MTFWHTFPTLVSDFHEKYNHAQKHKDVMVGTGWREKTEWGKFTWISKQKRVHKLCYFLWTFMSHWSNKKKWVNWPHSPLGWSQRTENQYLSPWYFLPPQVWWVHGVGEWSSVCLPVAQLWSLHPTPCGRYLKCKRPCSHQVLPVGGARESWQGGSGGSCLLPLPPSVPQLHFLPGWQFLPFTAAESSFWFF